jgi:hypothetical protein
MTSAKPILFEAEGETEYYTWRTGRAECDPGMGVITVCGVPGETPLITIPIDEVIGIEIIQRENISILLHIAFGALLADWNTGLGCLLSLILSPVAIVDRIVAKRTQFPAIKLTQSAGSSPERGWTLTIRSKRRGRRGREETRELANHLADVLRESGYSGLMPDLSAHELWFGAR